MQEGRNSSANVLELRFSCTDPSLWWRSRNAYNVPLCQIVHRKHKNVSIIYIIPPHWHDTGGWNPSSCKKTTYLFHKVNIMYVLATVMNWKNSFPKFALSISEKSSNFKFLFGKVLIIETLRYLTTIIFITAVITIIFSIALPRVSYAGPHPTRDTTIMELVTCWCN